MTDGGSKELKPVAIGCSITRVPDPHCDERRKITRHTPSVSGLWAPYTHRDCTCNELVAIRNRVIGAVPRPTKEGLSELAAEAQLLGRRLPRTGVMTYSGFVSHYTGRRRTRYQQAVDNLAAWPLDLRQDGRVSAFVKAEKFNPGGKVNPDPRMIQARQPRYNVELGRYLKPIEHHLYRLKSPRTGLPLLGKGLSMQERGRVLKKIWDSFKNPVCVTLDGSRFDQHVDAEVLKIEHSVYLACNSDPELGRLLQVQLRNRVTTARGYKYKTYGKRMSGDMNTALGNCVIMVCAAQAFARHLQLTAEVFDDGDDVLLLFEREHLAKVLAEAPAVFLTYGQEIKVENIAHRMEDIVWCQCKPVLDVDGEYMLVADWRKVLSQTCAGTRYWQETRTRYDMGFSVGQCLLAMYPGAPVIWKFAERLCSQGRLNRDVFTEVDWIHKVNAAGAKLGQLTTREPTPATRTSFAQAFGIDELDQLRLEQQLEHWSVGDGLVDVPPECDAWAWQYRLGQEPGIGIVDPELPPPKDNAS